MRSGEFLAGLLDHAGPGFVTAEDLDGPHGEALRTWQRLGYVAPDPGVHPTPSCPHCGEGGPARTEGRLVCTACRSPIDAHELRAWAVRRETVLAALATHLGLRGEIRPAGPDVWELGAATVGGVTTVCFYHRGGVVSGTAAMRLGAFRRVLVLHGPTPPDASPPGRRLPLADLLSPDGTLATATVDDMLMGSRTVRFDAATGGLRIGAEVVGEVPVGGREWALLACLADQSDQFVPYAELKREVLRRTGGRGGAEDATFCQKLKSRIKAEYVPGIDRLLVASHKADGYRLRAEVLL